MKVIRITKYNEDGSIQYDGMLGPNEAQYVLEQGFNLILQTGAETIEDLLQSPDDEDDMPPMEAPDSIQ